MSMHSDTINTLTPDENQIYGSVPIFNTGDARPAMASTPDMNSAPLTPEMGQHLIAAIYQLYANIMKTNQQTSELYKQHGIHWKNPALFKTSICDSWKSGQICKYGNRCWYAHGTEELRYVPRLDQIPVLLQSLSTLPTNLAQFPSWACDLPLEFYKNVPPPNIISSVVSAHQPTSACNNYNMGGTFSNLAPESNNALASPMFPYYGAYHDSPEVQGIPGIVSTDTESFVSDYLYPGRRTSSTSDFNNSAATNLKLKVQETLRDDNLQDPDVKSEWDELDSLIGKKREPGDNSYFVFEGNSSRAMFMKSFHPFGQSYPLNQNWL